MVVIDLAIGSRPRVGIAGRCAVNKGLLLPGHAKALFVHQEKIDHSQLFTLVSVFIMDLGMAIAAAIV